MPLVGSQPIQPSSQNSTHAWLSPLLVSPTAESFFGHQVAGDVAGRHAEGAQRPDGDVREVLADAGPLGPGVLTAAVHPGRPRPVLHLGADQAGQLLGGGARCRQTAHGIRELRDAAAGAGAGREHQPLVAAVLHGGVAHGLPVQRRLVPLDLGALDRRDRLDVEPLVLGEALHGHHVGAPVVAVDVAPRHRPDPDAVLERGLADLVERRHPQLVVGRPHPAVVGQGGRVHDAPAPHVRTPRPWSRSAAGRTGSSAWRWRASSP